MSESICPSRCICIHSTMQLVDLTISSVMLHHGIIPVPVQAVPKPPPQAMLKALQTIEKVQHELRDAFRSRHRRAIREVLLCIGPSPFRPHHVYALPISVCECEDSSEGFCGDVCSELSPSEIRKMNLRLFKTFPPETSSSQAQRLFVFLRAADSLVSENIEECEEPPQVGKVVNLDICHSNCDYPRVLDSTEKTRIRWMRLVPFIVQGKMV